MTKPSDFSRDEILRALMQKVVASKDARLYPVEGGGWDLKERVGTLQGDDHLRVTKTNAKPLVDAGLLEYHDSGTLGWTLTPKGIREAAKLVPPPAFNLIGMLDWILDMSYFQDPDESGTVAIPYIWDKGDKASKLVLILGENAGGKSFFRRIVRVATRKGGRTDMGRTIPAGPFAVQEMVHLSMEARTAHGTFASLVYGAEEYFSTGDNSANTITMGIKTLEGRGHTTVAYWDEPDIGMSNGAAAGAGILLRRFLKRSNPLIGAVLITTHNVALVQQLTKWLPAKPHYIYLGNTAGPATLADWLQYQQNPTPIMPEELHQTGHRRFKRIQKILDRKD